MKITNSMGSATLAAVAATIVAGCGGGDGGSIVATAPIADAPVACSALASTSIAKSDIGLPTSGAFIQSATFVAASALNNINGDHCQVIGVITPVDPSAPNILFEVNLPSNWNNKAVQYGGGGYNGSLVTGLTAAAMHPTTVDTPLKQGFITLGSDSGHQDADANWGLNDEALANFGHQQLKKTHDVAMALAKKRYGLTPTRFYFVGNSQGGHEALDVAARYPADYDGVVATHPAYNVPLLHLGSLNVVKAGAANKGTGWLNTNKHNLVKHYVMEACDGLDGLQDNIAGNLAACRQTVTMAKLRQPVAAGGLRCAGGADAGDRCLSDAQLDAVQQITSDYKPGFAIAGNDTFPGWGMLEGADLPLGSRAIPSNPPDFELDSFFSVIAAYTVQYVFAKDPNQDMLTFDPLQYMARIQATGNIMDVTSGDLTAFHKKGGKIIMTHGTADELITERNSEAYYNRQLAKFGQSTLDSFLKFYVIPGFSHGEGTFTARYDGLGQVVNWVENGKAPDGTFTTVDENTATNGRTRPMCLFGTYPKYKGGATDASLASSFSCVSS